MISGILVGILTFSTFQWLKILFYVASYALVNGSENKNHINIGFNF